jgi:hypothetical protein
VPVNQRHVPNPTKQRRRDEDQPSLTAAESVWQTSLPCVEKKTSQRHLSSDSRC